MAAVARARHRHRAQAHRQGWGPHQGATTPASPTTPGAWPS